MVMDKVTVHVGVDFFEVCFFFPTKIRTPRRQKEGSAVPCARRHPSELGLTLEDGCGPRGAHAHPGRVQGSAAVLGEPVELQDSLGAEGWGTLWTSWSGPAGHLCLTDGGG